MSASSSDPPREPEPPSTRSLETDTLVGSLHDRLGPDAAPPLCVGRYHLAGRLGEGGLGIVYRAFDPALARYVAIKVLKGGREAAEHDVRLLREAQVLARIRHPHVVEVFDVGFFEENGLSRFFVAMELVEGTDLRGWLAPGRSLAEIVGAFAAAAEGLAAAHAAGLLHRDFKPGNVLMGDDGAVKVADFGLAAVTHALRAEPDTGGWSLTEANATLSWRPGGTLHYMSPEQQRGEPLTPASDQFGFCVSLYEAVYGERPFEGSDRHVMLAAKEQRPSLPRVPQVPAALRRLLTRGLAPRPEDRFASMHALRQALLRVRPGMRRPGQLAVAGLVAIGVAMGVATTDPESPSTAPSCPSPPDVLLAGPSATTPAVEAVLRSSPPLARAWPAMAEALDAYAAELRTRWDGACSLPPPERDRVHRCLQQGSDGLHALHALLAAGERETLAQGWSLVQALPDVHACVPARGRGSSATVDAALGTTVDGAVARARMLVAAGQLAAAREVLAAMQADPAVDADARARRRVGIELAELSSLEGHHAQARQGLESLYFEAVGEGDVLGASRAAVWLVAQGYRTGDVEGARQWGRAARTQLERVQPRHHELETMLWHNLALIHLAEGDLVRALGTSRQAVVHASAPGVSASLRRATLQVSAELLMLNGRPAEALAIHRDQLHTDGAPPQRDPLAAVIDLQSLGNALMTLHDVDAAWIAYRDALELGRSILGPAHPDTAAACISFAWAEGDRGQPTQARKIISPCLEHLVQSLGDDHPHVAVARGMDGRLASQQGDHDEARRLLEGALASLERSLGESHYAVGDVLHELGLALAVAGDEASARTTLERALRVRLAALPEGHVYVAETQAELAPLYAAAGEHERAREHLQQALAGFEARALDPSYIARWRERLPTLDDPATSAQEREP